MAARETIIEVKIDNADAVQRLGKWEAELIAVRKAQTELRKEVRAAGEANSEQERDLGILASRAKALSGNIRELSNDTSGLTAAGMRFRDKMAQATLEALKQSGVMGQLDARTAALTLEIDRLNKEFAAGTGDAAAYTAQIDKLTKELEQTKAASAAGEARFNALEKEFKEGRISAEQFRASVDALNKEVASGGALKSGIADLKNYVLGTIGVVAAVQGVIAVFKDAARTVLEFDKALAGIRSLGDEYAARIGEIGEAAKTAGIAFGFTAVETAGAVDALARAGLSVDQILSGGLTGALELAAAGQIDLANASETAASALTQFGLSGDDVSRVADALVGGANAAQGGVDELRQALNQSGLVASQFGLSLEETVGALTTFASAGLLGSDAGTSFRSMLLRLAKPTEESTALLAQYNIQLFDAQGQFVGIEQAAEQLQNGLADLTDEQRNQALATIFGQDAIRAASVLFEQGAEGVAQYTKAVSETGIAARVAAEQTNTLSGDIERLGKTYDALVVSIEDGNGLISQSLRTFVVGIKDALAILGGFDERTKSIEGFTAQVQKEFAAIGGVGQLVAEEGDEIVNSLRLMAESVKDFGTEQIDTDLLLLKGREATDILRQSIVEGNKVQEAAARATIAVITEQINKRKEEAEESVAASELSRAAAKAEADANAQRGETLNTLAEKLKELQAARGDISATDTKALKENEAAIRSIEAQVKAIDAKTDATTKATAATKELTQAEKDRIAIANQLSADATENLFEVTPQTLQDVPLPEEVVQDDEATAIVEENLERLAELRAEAALREIRGIEDLNAEKLLLQQEQQTLGLMSYEEYAAKVGAIDDQIARQKLAAISAVGQAFGAFSQIAKKNTTEQKILGTASALINTYVGVTQALSDPSQPSTIVRFALAAAALAQGLAAVKQINSVQGFAEGGVVQSGDGKPIRRSNGDNTVITAKVGEMVLTEEQQREIQRRAGLDIFRQAGVPGSNRTGGYALGGTITRGTALVNLGGGPQVETLDMLRTNAVTRAADPNIFVRVTDINTVQGRRARVLERATL